MGLNTIRIKNHLETGKSTRAVSKYIFWDSPYY